MKRELVKVKRDKVELVHATLADALNEFDKRVAHVRQVAETYMNAHQELESALKAAHEEDNAERAQWEASFALCNTVLLAPERMVRFRACGQPFSLSVDTMLKYPGSFFAAYVSGR